MGLTPLYHTESRAKHTTDTPTDGQPSAQQTISLPTFSFLSSFLSSTHSSIHLLKPRIQRTTYQKQNLKPVLRRLVPHRFLVTPSLPPGCQLCSYPVSPPVEPQAWPQPCHLFLVVDLDSLKHGEGTSSPKGFYGATCQPWNRRNQTDTGLHTGLLSHLTLFHFFSIKFLHNFTI